MDLLPTALADVVEVRPARFGDHRGWFSESWNQQRWQDAGFDLDWVQDNESVSVAKGTVRGVHFQTEPHAQDKLVRVITGRIIDVAVDLRQGSPTFRQHVAVELTAELGNQLLVPKGFGHGFVTLEENCRVAYKVTGRYSKECDAGLSWQDPELAIDWGIDPADAVVSEKDAAAPLLADAAHLLFP
jgi:dTDP-4-dehydrorhamnose 3,5-epimerase